MRTKARVEPPTRSLMRIPTSILEASSRPATPSSHDGYITISLILSLPSELLDEIYTHLSHADRYSFALVCKHFARYAFFSPTFLEPPLRFPKPASSAPKARTVIPIFIPTRSTIPRTRAYRDLMQLLSHGWCPPELHWCDNCSRFRFFSSRMRGVWYSGRPRKDNSPEHSKKSGEWTQDIGLSVDGEVCWNHFCPECARGWSAMMERARFKVVKVAV